jgi:GT2 family glycosyltransferase
LQPAPDEEGTEVTDDRTISTRHAVGLANDRLAEENRELKARLQYLTNRQTALEQRLERVENSVVFRFLRWLGPKLGLTVIASAAILRNARNSPANANQRYAAWIEETGSQYGHEESALAPVPQVACRKTISVVLSLSRPDRSGIAAALTSLNSQQHSDWELFVCVDAAPPDWLHEVLEESRNGRAVEIVASDNRRERFRSALQQSRGEFIAILSGDAILEPDALGAWVAGAEPDMVAVHSDWDLISSTGRRHTPRFTPECSPELLSQTLYWGNCYLVRSAAVRELECPLFASNALPEHELAVSLVDRSHAVRRIPKVMWHLQDSAEDPSAHQTTALAMPRRWPAVSPRTDPAVADSDHTFPIDISEMRSSILICSRNAKLLDKCLKSLRPTLSSRDEIIIVAHQEGDSQALARTASNHHVKIVPYEGKFHFGLMNRLAVAASSAPVIVLINDDTNPVTEDWLEHMLAQAARPEVGIVGALLLYPNGTIEHAGIAVGGRHFPAHVGRFQNESPYWPWLRVTREVTAVTGACMAMRRVVWDELNGFDCRFPVNFNDVDLCLRAAERGYKVLLEARAVLTHEGCKTRTPTVQSEEHELLYKLWWPVMSSPDRFFNPQFGNAIEPILLSSNQRTTQAT